MFGDLIWIVPLFVILLALGAIYWNRKNLSNRPSKRRGFMEGHRRYDRGEDVDER